MGNSMDWRHSAELQAAGNSAYSELKNVCVWVKDNGGMGVFIVPGMSWCSSSKTAMIHTSTRLSWGRHGRYRTNVWNYRGISSSTKAAREELALHPTVKPVAMVADAMKDCSARGGLVLDAFCGSGTILIAAQKTGRRARAIEISPHYCDTSIRRWQAYAKDDAILVETGETFEEVKARRSKDRYQQSLYNAHSVKIPVSLPPLVKTNPPGVGTHPSPYTLPASIPETE